MSGRDTTRGINFQYSIAIGYILDFLDHQDWTHIQMEGDQDIEDIIIYGNDKIVRRIQIKQKRYPYQWKPSELYAILDSFSECDDNESVYYHFVYSGAEGKQYFGA